MISDYARRAADRLLGYLPGKLALHIQFLKAHGRLGDFKNPRLFSELIQARKLFNRNPAFVQLTDKLGAKAYVAAVLGEDWIIPTLWSGETLPPLEERRWPLPFVLKANHGSKWNIFVRSPEDLDWPKLETSAKAWMQADYRPYLKEWFHRKIRKKILVEPFQGDPSKPLIDYKFYCFGGKARYILVAVDRQTAVKGCVMLPDWTDAGVHFNDTPPDRPLPRPEKLDTLIHAAETLAKGFSFVRIDLYDIGGDLRFGEFTFTPHSGLYPMHPASADADFGSLWLEARLQGAPAIPNEGPRQKDGDAGLGGGATAI